MKTMILNIKEYWNTSIEPKIGETRFLEGTTDERVLLPAFSIKGEIIEAEAGCLSVDGNFRLWTIKEQLTFPDDTVRIMDMRNCRDYDVVT